MIEDHLLLGYIASEETYEDRTVIIEEGSKGEWICVVLEGRVKVKKKTEKGKVTLDTLKEGDIFKLNFSHLKRFSGGVNGCF